MDANSEHRAVEEALWAVMAGADSYSDESVSGSLKLGTGTNAFTNIGGDTAGDRTNGTYTINNRTSGVSGTGPNGTGITGNTGTGTGVGWEIDVTVSSGSVSAVSVISGGSNFDDGETIELANTAIGGGTGSVTLTIKLVVLKIVTLTSTEILMQIQTLRSVLLLQFQVLLIKQLTFLNLTVRY